MPIMTWNNQLSVDIGEIDDQHKILIELINRLNDAMKVGKGKEVIGGIIKELENYTITHFSKEEKYFDKFGYNEAASHKAQHKKFISDVKNFREQYESGTFGVAISTMAFLSDWLKNHIMITDKKYVPTI